MSDALFSPIFAYVLWVVVIYVLLTIMRAPSILDVGVNSDGANPFLEIEARTSANLSNQFEWPVLFFAVAIILIARPEFYHAMHLWLAWLFVFGRLLHSIVQIFTTNIRLRGMVFNINFLAVLGMWGFLAFNFFKS